MSESTSFVQLLVGFFLLATGVHATCPLKLSPSIVVLREGDPASSVCTATGVHEGMGWESSEGGIGLQKNTTHVTWAVKSLKGVNWELTPPVCFINPYDRKQCTKELKVVFYTFPENISIHSNSSELMIENEEYTFTCDIHRVAPVQNVTVKWYKGDTVIRIDTLNSGNGSNDSKSVSQSTDLKFSPTKKDNGTRLRCEVHMDLTPEGPKLNISSEDYFIKVIPGISLTCPSTYTAREDVLHNLTCTVDSNREYEVIWYKDGEEVKLPERLTRSDAGQYLIVASNLHGGSHVSLTLDISVEYPPTRIAELEDSEVNAGKDLWLKCSSRSDPRPTYSWNYSYPDNVAVSNEDGVTYLQIHNATAYNTGSYTCYAQNDMGGVGRTVRVTVKGKIKPDTAVAQYQGGSWEATWKSNHTNVKEIARQHQNGSRIVDWTLENTCVPIVGSDRTPYKTPDSVSIRSLNNSISVEEGVETQLRCDIINVAPVQNLTVQWHKGNETIAEMEVVCGETRSPANVSSTIRFIANRSHNGAEIVCEARLNQPLGSLSWNDSVNITVSYKPVINKTKLQDKMPLFRGYSTELVCEADGTPPPNITWSSDRGSLHSGGTLTVLEAGTYICTASNSVGSASLEVRVILTEDYLPLIAGFVAVMVVAISIIFLCIYSIYYKNTKMRRYSLKNPNFSTQNGNVAHNGWEIQFPMNKLP